MARVLGAGRVVAVVRAGARERVAGLAADAVVEIHADDAVADATARIAEAAAGMLDLVEDPLWGTPGAAAFPALSPGAGT